ncbi:MAG: hypothetical protein PUP91_36220 [Rhizonema sp. PD37]|nr:hypothetical protein [Rhizonema sp. PD37]
MPKELIADTSLDYYLVNFDALGDERDEPNGTLMSQRLIEMLQTEPISDVFVISHGWLGDIPAARDQYSRWIRAMAANTADIEKLKQVRSNFKPLLIALHWPSLPWGNETLKAETEEAFVNSIVSEYTEQIADTEPARNALRTIGAEALKDVAPDQLSAQTVQAYKVLNQEAALGSEGEAAAPGNDREPFDPETIYDETEIDEDSVGYDESGDLILSRIFSPLRSLSYWKMKARARQFGEGGGFEFLSKLQQKAAEETRFHLIGHSFGCIVVSGTLAGPKGKGVLPRPVNSLSLIQGALSLWSYCADIPVAKGKPGYFYPLIAESLVAGPIITTRSEHDSAVGTLYPLASGIVMSDPDFGDDLPRYGGIGTFGIQGDGLEINDINMLPCDQAYNFEPGKIYNIEASKYIRKIPPNAGLGGAHSSIDEPEVAHAVWSAVIGI